MRVANKSIYDSVTFTLGNITEDLYKANKVVATGKRINSLSDDPVCLTQCLKLRSSLANLEQLGKNIAMGRTWLNAGETALDSINDLISDTKVLSIQMANGSINATDRTDAAEVVDGYLRQILSLANTEVNGEYIFAGTKTDTQPFAFDDEANPTVVTYSGNDSPFTVKIGKDATVAVGRDGEEAFWDTHIIVDDTNNGIGFT
ncbi:MAG TPA: flagellar hook-associated protein 3, partial [Desulfobacterales bacterium]|nr:flagellar hook-associated protein 3 [Desulfobacterales bacterium]